jgi:isoleucyl-tRNA synthetase
VLSGTVRLLAPFVPFVSEEVYQALEGALAPDDGDRSVHLEDFPTSDAALIDTNLEALMDTAIRVASLGRTVRNEAGIKIRQPLSEMLIRDNAGRCQSMLGHDEIRSIVVDELHIKRLEIMEEAGKHVAYKAAPNFPALGKRFGKNVPDIAEKIRNLPAQSLESFRQSGEVVVATAAGEATLGRDELSVAVEGLEPFAAWEEHGITVALNLEVDESLRMEGIAREIVNRLQNLRKKAGYDVSDRIDIRFDGGMVAEEVFARQGELIRAETLARSSEKVAPGWPETTELDVEGERIRLWIRRESD